METVTLHGFPGGIRLQARKGPQTARPIAVLPPPAQLVLPLSQHIGLPARPVVKVGARVLRGQAIGVPDGAISAPVHASTSGIVRAIEPRPVAHPSSLDDLCIVIEADGEDRAVDATGRDHDYHLDDPGRLRREVADAGIVGLGGAVFPSAIKLAAEAETRLHTLIINGAECEPYISCDDMLMRERAAGVLRGARCMLHILQINRCLIALEEDKPEALAALRHALAELGDDRLILVEVPARYPEGGERQLIQMLSGEEVPSDGLPPDIGFLCHNPGTAYAVHRAIVHGEALTSRIVTVCGSGIAAPRNVEARLGTPVADLVAACGGYRDDPRRLIMGGEMMGVPLRTDAVPVVKAFNCLLALAGEDVRPPPKVRPCIRCGECQQVCPALLMPQQLHWYAQGRQFDRAVAFHLFDCIECGCCDLVCPSQIPLSEQFRYAKSEVIARDRERLRASHARRRYEKRSARLAFEKERRQRRVSQRAAPAGDGNDDAQRRAQIDAAVARAKARRAARADPDDDDAV